MNKVIQPCRHPVSAVVNIPGSKSITNRALICAALARGESVLRRASDSDDTALMCNGLNQLGILVRREADTLVVSGTGGRLYAPKFPIPVGNAGTTLRFLFSLAALAEGRTVFQGDARMAERPMDDLLAALSESGVPVDNKGQGNYSVEGGKLRGGNIHIRSAKSSQFLSSLLMVAPYTASDVTLEIAGALASGSYVDLTVQVMQHFGVKVEHDSGPRWMIQSGQRYTPCELEIEVDASSAGYFFSAAALCGGEILVKGFSLKSLQPDTQFIMLLREMGCSVLEEDDGVRVCETGRLRGIEADMNAIPDAVPTLAALAPFASTPTRIVGVPHLRHKESDRLMALETELRKLGAHVTPSEDGLEIHPSQLKGCKLDTYNDHRLAMSFALIGLKIPGVEIENPACVKKSFPKFWNEFEKLYDVGSHVNR